MRDARTSALLSAGWLAEKQKQHRGDKNSKRAVIQPSQRWGVGGEARPLNLVNSHQKRPGPSATVEQRCRCEEPSVAIHSFYKKTHRHTAVHSFIHSFIVIKTEPFTGVRPISLQGHVSLHHGHTELKYASWPLKLHHLVCPLKPQIIHSQSRGEV